MAHYRTTCKGSRGAASRLGQREAHATIATECWTLSANSTAHGRQPGTEGDTIDLSLRLDNGQTLYIHIYLDEQGRLLSIEQTTRIRRQYS